MNYFPEILNNNGDMAIFVIGICMAPALSISKKKQLFLRYCKNYVFFNEINTSSFHTFGSAVEYPGETLRPLAGKR